MTMPASDLKFEYQQANPNGHFFDRKTLAFFGDTMKNYGVRNGPGNTWELYRKRPVKFGVSKSVYFDKVTYKERTSIEEDSCADTTTS